MECPACHTANPENYRFCENCGEALPYKCAACGFDCSPQAKFCGGCGVPLVRLALPGAIERAAAAPSGAASRGELKQATVLFADIVSSTEQIAGLDPEQAMNRLQPAIALMCEAVERFGGTVMRTLGDGVMAIFGVPKAQEGHANLACESALHMQAAFTGSPQGLSIRVGLHSGLVASDPHSHDSGKGGGAHGLTIHLASRVVGLAPPGGVAMTQDCHSLVRGAVEVESIGCPHLKGIPHPPEIFLLKGLNPAFASQHFHQAKLTQFRGRDEELLLLQQAQRRAEAGDAQVLGISGGPGTGKSRLCYEFAQWCRSRGTPVFEVCAQRYGSAAPLQPVLELMRTFFFGISAGDSPGVARSKISARLQALGSSQPADAALLNDFLGVPDSGGAGASPEAHGAKARRARLVSLVEAMVKQAGNTVSVVIIEDLHWLDEASEEFVAALVRAIASTRATVVLNYRSSYRSPWAAFDHFQEIELADLTVADTEALVRELIRQRREFQDLSQLIVRRSGGNPFFAEELVRSLAERVVPPGGDDQSKNTVESVERALPATVQAVIGARIDRLGESEKSLLQMCSIIGKEIPLPVLEQVAGTLRTEIDRTLDDLCRAELLQSLPQAAAGEKRFAFRHPLIQEVAYSTQLKARRSAIHASVAGAMEHHFADRLDEYSALVSHHYEAAGHALRAAEYSGRAAQWLGSTDSAQAIKHWHKARALLSAQEGNRESDRLRAMACSQISLLGWREGLSLEDVRPFLQEAMDLAGKVDARLTQLLVMIEGRMLQAGGGPADWYVTKAQEALTLAGPGTDKGRKATISAVLCQAYGWAGLLQQALAANDAALNDLGAIDKFDREFIGFSAEQWVLGMRCRLLTRLGRYDEAAATLDTMAEAGRGSTDPLFLQMVHYAHIDLAWCVEDCAMAQEHAAPIIELAEKHPNAYMRVFALHGCASAKSMAGDLTDAIGTLREALALVRSAKVAMEFEPEILASLADAYRSSGDHEQAVLFAREAIEISRQRSTRLAECRALITLAVSLADHYGAERLDESASALAEAERLLELTGATAFRRLLPPPNSNGLNQLLSADRMAAPEA